MSKKKGDGLQVGDIVRITCEFIPGLDHLKDHPMVGDDILVEDKLGTIIDGRPGRWKVRVDSYGVDHAGWWFSDEDLVLEVRNPDYEGSM